MIKLTTDRLKVFKNEREGKTWFSFSISNKKQNGEYEYMSKTIKFRKDHEPSDSCDIKINDAFLTFSTSNDKQYDYLMVMDYELLNEEKSIEKKDIEITDDDLPF